MASHQSKTPPPVRSRFGTDGIWLSNPGYSQMPGSSQITGSGSSFSVRIGVPFTEPSFASAFWAAVTVSGFSLVLWGRQVWGGLVVLLLGIAGALNTKGTTGIVATVLLLPVMFLWFSVQSWHLRVKRPELIQRWLLLVVVLFALILLAVMNESLQTYLEQIQRMASQTIEKLKFEFEGKYVRYQVDQRGMEILRETSGLGVGLGSARMSSFVVSMLAATGIPGTLLWFGALGTLAWRYLSAPRLSDGQLIAISGLIGCTVAMSLAIPDLNMPMYWAFIFLAFVYCPNTSTTARPIMGSFQKTENKTR